MTEVGGARIEDDGDIDVHEVAEYACDIARELAVLARASNLAGVAQAFEQAERAAKAALYDLSRKAAPEDAA